MNQLPPDAKLPQEREPVNLGVPRATRRRDRCLPPVVAEHELFDRTEVAIVIPCYNEAKTIKSVVRDFQRQIPHAVVYVFDNDSTDTTAAEAKAAGATVIWEGRRGKGNVVRRMFAEVMADAYVLVDGDGTYDAAAAPYVTPDVVKAWYTEHGQYPASWSNATVETWFTGTAQPESRHQEEPQSASPARAVPRDQHQGALPT